MEFQTASLDFDLPSKKQRYYRENAISTDSSLLQCDYPTSRFTCLPSIRSLPRPRGSEYSRDYTPSTNSSSSGNSTFQSEQKTRSVSLSRGKELAPFVSAMTWAITNGYTGTLLWGSIENERREIASLTKIMTCFVALKLLKSRRDISVSTIIKVSARAASMIGTSARLREGDELHLWDALHGMMLPSGNDAAYCIGEFLGKCLRDSQDPHPEVKPRSNISYFISEMNKTARELGLTNTSFGNAHGLPHVKNHSCARDVGALASLSMQDSLFSQIVNTTVYTCYISQTSSVYSYRKVRWYNTNRMLDLGWDGVKTGVTNIAGPCFCGSIRQGSFWLIVTVLGSRTMDRRWTEVEKLAKWGFMKLGISKQCDYSDWCRK